MATHKVLDNCVVRASILIFLNKEVTEIKNMKTWQKGVCIGAVVGVAAPFAIVGGLAVAGFGAGGVVAGSAAAGAQAAIGNVAAGSLFASKSK